MPGSSVPSTPTRPDRRFPVLLDRLTLSVAVGAGVGAVAVDVASLLADRPEQFNRSGLLLNVVAGVAAAVAGATSWVHAVDVDGERRRQPWRRKAVLVDVALVLVGISVLLRAAGTEDADPVPVALGLLTLAAVPLLAVAHLLGPWPHR